MDTKLIYSVTGFGFLLALLSFFIIIRGKAIPGENNTNQELEYKGLKIKTNGVVMLLALSLIVAVLPLSLQAFIEKNKTILPSQEIKQQSQSIFVTGNVFKANGAPVEGAAVTVTHVTTENQSEPKSYTTDNSGAFDFNIQNLEKNDQYRIVATKKGLVSEHVIVAPSFIKLNTVLFAERKDGGM